MVAIGIRVSLTPTEAAALVRTQERTVAHTGYSAQMYKHEVHKPEGRHGDGDNSTHIRGGPGKRGPPQPHGGRGVRREVCKVSPWSEAL